MQDRDGAKSYQVDLGRLAVTENVTRENYRAWDIEQYHEVQLFWDYVFKG